MRKKRIENIERNFGIGKPIVIYVERSVDHYPSSNLSEVTKLTKITIAPGGTASYEILIDKYAKEK